MKRKQEEAPEAPVLSRAQIKEVNAIKASEMRLVGSFFIDPELKREANFWGERHTELNGTMMRDPFVKSAWYAIELTAESNSDLTVWNVANKMVEMLGEQAEVYGDAGAIVERLVAYARTGATRLSEFHFIENQHWDRIRQEAHGQFIQQATAIMDAKDGRTPGEKVWECKLLAERMVGGDRMASSSMGWDEMTDILHKMPEEMAALAGTQQVQMPPHFGKISESIRWPARGEMGVISGPSGGGKSTMIWTFFEWNVYFNGQKALGLAYEDDRRTILRRACARWIPGTTYQELTLGDHNNRMDMFSDALTIWRDNGGEIRYEECPGLGGTETIKFLRMKLDDGIASGRPYDIVVIDYFQKIDFLKDGKMFDNKVIAAEWVAEQLRIIAQTYNIVLVIASQVSTGADGTAHIAWSNALGHKSQWHVNFSQEFADQDAVVYGDTLRQLNPITIATAGEKLPFITARIVKANRYAPATEVLQVMGAQQRVVVPAFQLAIAQNPELEYMSRRFQLATAEDMPQFKSIIEREALITQQAHKFTDALHDKANGRKRSKGYGDADIPD